MNRPKIIINCAMSADGKIALPNKTQMRISSELDMKRVYNLRNSCDAVLVGIGAVLSDDPKLTVKEKYVETPRQPIRIVLDTYCKTPTDALVVNEKAKTILCCKENNEKKMFQDNVEILICKTNQQNHLDLHDVLNRLAQKGIQTILIEGGGTIIWSFLKERLVDDLYVYIGPIIIGGKQTPTMADGMGITNADDAIPLNIKNIEPQDNGVLMHYQLRE